MGQNGSSQLAQAPRRTHYHHASSAASLPHEPPRLAPKVLPSIQASPRLRCTDNGVILHSGGTISGRRPLSATLPTAPAQHARLARTRQQHADVYRSRSASSGEQTPPAPSAAPPHRGAGAAGAAGRPLRERDPLHRSQTHLDLHEPLEATSKRFGSEPDLRNEDEQPKQRTTKHFRKKYKAPQPPAQHDVRDGSSPDSYDGNNRNGPVRKLRLFKTRSETKNFCTQIPESKCSQPCRNSSRVHTEHKSVTESQSLERRYRSPCKEKDQFLKYPDSKERDMIQSPASLRTEEHLLQASTHKNEYRKCKTDQFNAYRSKASKNQNPTNARKTPHLDRTFRYSERFKKEEPEPAIFRRERSFDATLAAKEHNKSDSPNVHLSRIKVIGEQLKSSRLSQLATNDKPLRKSLPSLLVSNNEEKDEFQAELKKATNRIRNENYNNVNDHSKVGHEHKPSQKDIFFVNKNSNGNPTNVKKPNQIQNIKVKESSQKKSSLNVIRQESNVSKTNNDRHSPNRVSQSDTKKLVQKQNALNRNLTQELNRRSLHCKQESRGLTDRGQASGKESTPEHSPSRLNEIEKSNEREKPAPSKQFYFGMIESKDVDINENLKDFPGLGSPIIEEFSNFHLIEKKLLGYHDKKKDVDNFPKRLQGKGAKNVSSESALSSSEEEAGSAGSAESPGISINLRPTVPKKQLEIPRFSPAAAWRQLAQLECELATQQSLAVEVKMPRPVEPPAESPLKSDKSEDKSGDSGISGDHAHSDERLDSLPRPHVARAAAETSAWTPLQDLEGDSGSDGAAGAGVSGGEPAVTVRGEGLVTYSARGQPFSLSLPRDHYPDKAKQFQQPFNSLQKLKKSVSGALGAALGSRRFDLEHELVLDEPSEQNWFLSKSAPNSLTNPFMYQPNSRPKGTNEGDIKEEPTPPASDQEDVGMDWSNSGGGTGGTGGRGASYMSWGAHVMYLPPAPAASAPSGPSPASGRLAHLPHLAHSAQPLSLHVERPMRSKSSGEIELRSRAARATRGLEGEMRERERSASPAQPGRSAQPAQAGQSAQLARALPARIVDATSPSPPNTQRVVGGGGGGGGGAARSRGKRFTFQSTVRQLERRRIADRLSREADLKEQQRRTELEAMRRVEEEFQRKRAREKASIRQQLRLVSGTASLPPLNTHKHARDEPDGAVSSLESPAPELASPVRAKDRERRERDEERREGRHSNASSEISGRSKSTTPVRCVELSEWRDGGGGVRQYRDWGAPLGAHPAQAHSIAHPPACYRMPKSPAPVYLNANGKDAVDTFSGSPRSDNYRLEFARGVPRSPRSPHSPRTPRAPRHPLAGRLPAPHSPSSSGSELSARQAQAHAIRLREGAKCGAGAEGAPEPAIVPTLHPNAAPPRRRPHH